MHQRALQRPFLTLEHAKRRLSWALAHRDKPVEWWRRFYSVTKRVWTVVAVNGRSRFSAEKKNPVYYPNMHSLQTQMFWGGIRYGKRSFLIALDGDSEAARGGVTGRVYRDHLDEYLPGCLDNDSIFMQDNAPVHTARIVKEWLQRQDIEVLEWPAYSPDLNPIENVWKLLKERIQKKEPKLKSLGNTQEALDLLTATAITVWEEFAEGMLNDLIDSMPSRIEAVVAAQGWYTKY